MNEQPYNRVGLECMSRWPTFGRLAGIKQGAPDPAMICLLLKICLRNMVGGDSAAIGAVRCSQGFVTMISSQSILEDGSDPGSWGDQTIKLIKPQEGQLKWLKWWSLRFQCVFILRYYCKLEWFGTWRWWTSGSTRCYRRAALWFWWTFIHRKKETGEFGQEELWQPRMERWATTIETRRLAMRKTCFFLWCENETRLFQCMGVGTRFLAQENENIGVQRDSVMEIPCWWKYYIALYCRCITHVRNVYRWTSSCTKIGW